MAEIHWQQFNEFNSFPLLLRVLTIRETVLGSDHPETLSIVRSLASGYSTLVSFKEAAPLWRRILEHFDRGAAPGNEPNIERLLGVLFQLGKAYGALSDYAAAEITWRRYLTLPDRQLAQPLFGAADRNFNLIEPTYVQYLEGLYGVGRACIGQGKWVEAEPFLHDAVTLHEQYSAHVVYENGGVYCLGLDSGLHDYAKVLQQLGRSDEALPIFKRALAMNRQQGLRFADLLQGYAMALRDMQRPDEAVKLEQRAEAIESEVAARLTWNQMRRARTFEQPGAET